VVNYDASLLTQIDENETLSSLLTHNHVWNSVNGDSTFNADTSRHRMPLLIQAKFCWFFFCL